MGKKLDLTGQVFGRLTVIEQAHIGKRGVTYWKCKCSCEDETEIVVLGSKLTTGHVKSCGCLRKEAKGSAKNIKDLTGKKFGKLTVVGLDHTKHGAYWKCKCDCNQEKEVVVLGSRLISGATQSCGCLKVEKAKSKRVDLSGKLFGSLRVLYYNEELRKWHCICENDGNEVDVASNSLKSGRTKSCGCLHKKVMHDLNFIDITGRVFNNLKVLEFVGINNGKYYWKCICLNCGKEHIIDRSKLGITQSCGCLDVAHAGSSAENEIKDYILKWFPNLQIEKSRVLDGKEIDIYIPSMKVGIEYNGSAYHATENGLYKNLDKYYHRDKFLLAKSKGIHLITVFDKDYEENKWQILERIRHIISGNKQFFIPDIYEVITDNDYDIGTWLLDYGYVEGEQIEPESFRYGKNYLVYKCGKTKWYKI